MPRAQLRQAQVDRLFPRRTRYIVRDSEVRGFGVRVSPSGRKRYVLQAQHEGTRIWRDCGNALSVSLADACELAITELRQLQRPDSDPSSRYPALAFETVAEEVFRRYGRRWKPRTLYAAATTAGKSCRGSKAARSPQSRRRTCRRGSPPFGRRPSLPTDPPQCCP